MSLGFASSDSANCIYKTEVLIHSRESADAEDQLSAPFCSVSCQRLEHPGSLVSQVFLELILYGHQGTTVDKFSGSHTRIFDSVGGRHPNPCIVPWITVYCVPLLVPFYKLKSKLR